jgi:hypothetical protein
MNKPRLLYHPDRSSVFRTATHFESFFDKYFIREPIDFGCTYDPKECIITLNPYTVNEAWHKPYTESGFRVILDNLWDNPVATASTVQGSTLTLRAPNWAWFNEALMYIDRGYNKIKFDHAPDKFFLMLMRLKRPHRDQILERTQSYLVDSLYSYVAHNILLDNDQLVNGEVEQRYLNPYWYESTSFSLVAESNLTLPTFMSEKTFKPVAFEHPFVVWGSPGTLNYLHTSGFETFSHVIDETYDTINNNKQRLDNIINVVDKLFVDFKNKKLLFSDSLTIEKIKHNRDHFYNYTVLSNMVIKEIINPMLEFIEQ